MGSREGRRPRLPLRSPSLGAKLILFSTLLTVVAVCVAFLFLSIQIRRHTKTLLAETLAHHERMILNLQQRSLEELLRTSTLMTDSPTLRAAMETYESESSPASSARPDLLATIQTEANKVAAGLGRDLLVVTDHGGKVLAAFGRSAGRPAVGDDLSLRGIVRRALDQNAPVGTRNFAVLDLGGAYFQVGCVPILLQGFVIGTLTLGDRIDEGFVRKLQQSFDSDFVVAINGLVVGSTLPRSLVADADLRALASLPPADRRASVVTRLGEEEFVAATLALGSNDPGHDVTLYLLHSLTQALGRSNQFLLLLLLACGSAAVLLAGMTAWWMSRSVLRPLESFVDFMTSVAKSGDHARRFPSSITCIEVEALNEAYSHLMESLEAHEERLLQSAKEDLDRLTRLQESEKLAALGRMLSGAAHEINNPLTGVVGNIELLLRDDRLDPDVRGRLERVRREGQRIVALVRNLLKVSHRDTGEKAVVDIRPVIHAAVDVRRHDFVTAGIGLEVHLASDPIPVLGSELELQQVFLNIINNAYDALRESAGATQLTIRTSTNGGQASVVFADNGPGMKDPKKVFDHFYTTKGVGKGTGLGLSLCYAIVQDHQGQVTAENLPDGGGARFAITLPLAACRESTVPAAVLPELVVSRGTEAPLAASVLIVDDEPTIVDLQKEILESLGAAVVGVGSGTEAIELLEKRPFDLIVTDLKMPGHVSGEDLYRWVQSHLPRTARGFVFVTGDAAGEINRDFIEQMGARCLLKPFSMEEYVQAVRETFHEIRPDG